MQQQQGHSRIQWGAKDGDDSSSSDSDSGSDNQVDIDLAADSQLLSRAPEDEVDLMALIRADNQMAAARMEGQEPNTAAMMAAVKATGPSSSSSSSSAAAAAVATANPILLPKSRKSVSEPSKAKAKAKAKAKGAAAAVGSGFTSVPPKRTYTRTKKDTRPGAPVPPVRKRGRPSSEELAAWAKYERALEAFEKGIKLRAERKANLKEALTATTTEMEVAAAAAEAATLLPGEEETPGFGSATASMHGVFGDGGGVTALWDVNSSGAGKKKKKVSATATATASDTRRAPRDPDARPVLVDAALPKKLRLTNEHTCLWAEARRAYIDGDYAAAMRLCSNLISEQTKYPYVYQLMGVMYEEQGDAAKAFDFYFMEATLYSGDKGLCKRVAFMALELGQSDQAQFLLNKALPLNRQDPELCALRTAIHVRRGDVPQAERSLLAALSKFPESIELLADYAAECFKVRREDRGVRAYAKYLFHVVGTSTLSPSAMTAWRVTAAASSGNQSSSSSTGTDITTAVKKSVGSSPVFEVDYPTLYEAAGCSLDVLLDTSSPNASAERAFELAAALLHFLTNLRRDAAAGEGGGEGGTALINEGRNDGVEAVAIPQLPLDLAFLVALAHLTYPQATAEHTRTGLLLARPVLAELHASDAVAMAAFGDGHQSGGWSSDSESDSNDGNDSGEQEDAAEAEVAPTTAVSWRLSTDGGIDCNVRVKGESDSSEYGSGSDSEHEEHVERRLVPNRRRAPSSKITGELMRPATTHLNMSANGSHRGSGDPGHMNGNGNSTHRISSSSMAIVSGSSRQPTRAGATELPLRVRKFLHAHLIPGCKVKIRPTNVGKYPHLVGMVGEILCLRPKIWFVVSFAASCDGTEQQQQQQQQQEGNAEGNQQADTAKAAVKEEPKTYNFRITDLVPVEQVQVQQTVGVSESSSSSGLKKWKPLVGCECQIDLDTPVSSDADPNGAILGIGTSVMLVYDQLNNPKLKFKQLLGLVGEVVGLPVKPAPQDWYMVHFAEKDKTEKLKATDMCVVKAQKKRENRTRYTSADAGAGAGSSISASSGDVAVVGGAAAARATTTDEDDTATAKPRRLPIAGSSEDMLASLPQPADSFLDTDVDKICSALSAHRRSYCSAVQVDRLTDATRKRHPSRVLNLFMLRQRLRYVHACVQLGMMTMARREMASVLSRVPSLKAAIESFAVQTWFLNEPPRSSGKSKAAGTATAGSASKMAGIGSAVSPSLPRATTSIYTTLGHACLATGNFGAAAKFFLDVLSIDREAPEALVGLSQLAHSSSPQCLFDVRCHSMLAADSEAQRTQLTIFDAQEEEQAEKLVRSSSHDAGVGHTSMFDLIDVGSKVKISPKHIKQRFAHLEGAVGVVVALPVHPSTWIPVQFPEETQLWKFRTVELLPILKFTRKVTTASRLMQDGSVLEPQFTLQADVRTAVTTAADERQQLEQRRRARHYVAERVKWHILQLLVAFEDSRVARCNDPQIVKDVAATSNNGGGGEKKKKKKQKQGGGEDITDSDDNDDDDDDDDAGARCDDGVGNFHGTLTAAAKHARYSVVPALPPWYDSMPLARIGVELNVLIGHAEQVLRTRSDKASYLCIMVPLLEAWIQGITIRGKAVTTKQYEDSNKVSCVRVYMTELQACPPSVGYTWKRWLDEPQNCMWRFVRSLCYFQCIECLLGKCRLQHILERVCSLLESVHHVEGLFKQLASELRKLCTLNMAPAAEYKAWAAKHAAAEQQQAAQLAEEGEISSTAASFGADVSTAADAATAAAAATRAAAVALVAVGTVGGANVGSSSSCNSDLGSFCVSEPPSSNANQQPISIVLSEEIRARMQSARAKQISKKEACSSRVKSKPSKPKLPAYMRVHLSAAASLKLEKQQRMERRKRMQEEQPVASTSADCSNVVDADANNAAEVSVQQQQPGTGAATVAVEQQQEEEVEVEELAESSPTLPPLKYFLNIGTAVAIDADADLKGTYVHYYGKIGKVVGLPVHPVTWVTVSYDEAAAGAKEANMMNDGDKGELAVVQVRPRFRSGVLKLASPPTEEEIEVARQKLQAVFLKPEVRASKEANRAKAEAKRLAKYIPVARRADRRAAAAVVAAKAAAAEEAEAEAEAEKTYLAQVQKLTKESSLAAAPALAPIVDPASAPGVALEEQEEEEEEEEEKEEEDEEEEDEEGGIIDVNHREYGAAEENPFSSDSDDDDDDDDDTTAVAEAEAKAEAPENAKPSLAADSVFGLDFAAAVAAAPKKRGRPRSSGASAASTEKKRCVAQKRTRTTEGSARAMAAAAAPAASAAPTAAAAAPTAAAAPMVVQGFSWDGGDDDESDDD